MRQPHNHTSVRSSAKKAFTLIELLVAVVIILILAAMISPVVGHFKKKAWGVVDISNLRQIGIGAFQYMGDNNGRLPPVLGRGDGKTVYAQEAIAEEIGITASLRATDVPRDRWGPFISPSDQRTPPSLSPLRCYGVNFYMGEITHITNDPKIATTYLQILKPSKVLYFLPMKSTSVDPVSQARFALSTAPIVGANSPSYEIRFESNGTTPALWADGHVSSVKLSEIKANAPRFIFPKSGR